MTRGLEMWTIYDHPKDYPDCFVARMHVARREGVEPSTQILTADTLDALRGIMEMRGLVCLTRDPNDDAKIVETWL
jgi:hypothetical protein